MCLCKWVQHGPSIRIYKQSERHIVFIPLLKLAISIFGIKQKTLLIHRPAISPARLRKFTFSFEQCNALENIISSKV